MTTLLDINDSKNWPNEIRFSKTKGHPVSQELKEACMRRAVECFNIAQLPKTMPTISFDLRGTTAGEAFYLKNHLRFNAQLLHENKDHFVHQVVAHEFAHLSSFVRHGEAGKGHGLYWRQEMSLLGVPAHQFHNYAVTPARTTGGSTNQTKIVREEGDPRFLPSRLKIRCGCATGWLSGAKLYAWQEGSELICPRCNQRFLPLQNQS